MDVSETNTCPSCGYVFPPGDDEPSLAGLCPRCLAGGLGKSSNETEPNLRTENSKVPIETLRPPLKPGATFKGFEVLAVLGQGGMGVVYKARQQSLNRLVALKVLNSQLASSEEFAARFDREAKVLASLNHPNVVQVFDFGKEEGLLYLVMEHVDGSTLEDVMKQKKQDPARFLSAVRDVARGLERVHAVGLVHRDIKPSNILIAKDGTAKISDFGLAVETEETQKLTQSGMFVGTPHYVSPEHAQGKKVDGRSDLYSLGVILFEGYAGRPPFHAASATALLLKHVNEAPPALYKLAPQSPKTVQEAVRRLLAKNPAARYDTAAALLKDLDRAVEETKNPPKALPGTARKVPAPAPQAPEAKLPLKWTGAGVAAAALIGILFAVFSGKSEPPRKEEKPIAANLPAPPLPKQEPEKIKEAELTPAPTPIPSPSPTPLTTPEELRTPSAVEGALRQGELLFEQARAAYEDGKARSSVETLTDAGFKADAARVKFVAVQEIGTDELKAKAVEQLRLVQQFQKLVNESRLAILNAKGDAPAPAPPTPLPANPVAAPAVAPAARPAVPAPATTRRSALPNATVQKDAEKQIRTLFKDDYAKKSPADVQALARKLLEQGTTINNDDAARYVMLRDARDFAAQAGDLDTAIRAVDALGQSFEVDPVSTKVAVINKAAPLMRGAEGMSTLAKAYLAVMEEGIASGQYDAALTVTSKAEASARGANDALLVARVQSVAKDLSFLQRENASVRTSLKTLEQKPDDPAANLAVGRFASLGAGDWAKGLPMLVKGSEALLKAAAEKDLAAGDDAGSQVAAGDAWWAAAEKEQSADYKKRMQARAARWYLGALPGATGLAKLQSEARLKQVGGLLLPSPLLTQRTELVGGSGGAGYDDSSRDGGVLVGLRMNWADQGLQVLKAVQPLFSSGSSLHEGPVRGKPQGTFKEAVAKPGYAVGGILARGSNRVNGMKVVFMKIAGIGLDPRDSYESAWFGDRGANDVRLGLDGTYVLGICGGAFEDVDSLGLLMLRRGEGRSAPAPAAAPAGSGSPLPKGTIDLLALVDPAKDAVVGEWSLEDKALVSTGGSHVRLMLPVIPPDEYDLKIVMERREGNDGVAFGLARGANQWTVYVDKLPTEGYHSGIELVDNQMSTLVRGQQLFNGQPSTFEFKVRKTDFTVLKDGKTLINWQGNTSHLSNFPKWEVSNPRALFLGQWESRVCYTEIRLTPVSGEGKLLRAGGAAVPTIPKNAIDLLALIDPQVDAVKGDWAKDGKGLMCAPGDAVRLQVPYSPPDEYDLSMTVTRREGGDGLLVGLVKGSAQWSVTMDTVASGSFKTGFESIDNQGPSGNPTTYSGPVFTNGVEARLEFRVRKAGVTVIAEGKTIIDWKGNFNRLSLPDGWKVRSPNALFLGAWGSRYHVSKIWLVPVSGQGTVLRGKPVLVAPAKGAGDPDATPPGFVSLMHLIDVQKDTVSGAWNFQDGKLVSNDAERAKIEIPYRPPAEYDFRIVFSRVDGIGDINQILTKAGRPFAWVMGGMGNTNSGFGSINGKWAPEPPNPSLVKFGVDQGRTYVSVVEVRKDGLKSYINGALVCQWRTNYGDMDLDPVWRVRDSSAIGLGTFTSPTMFHRIEIREVSGQGKKTR
jgi:serine/threonine protein kinase